MLSPSAIYTVWLRDYLTWRALMWSSLFFNVLNPLTFLYAFGFGLGMAIPQINGIPYIAYILPGMMAYGMMFSAAFETTVSVFVRITMQHNWAAIAATKIKLTEIMLGETLWATTKGLFSAIGILLAGAAFGGVLSTSGAFIAIPVLLLGGLCFAAVGMLVTAHAKTFEMFSYHNALWVTPNFLFSGVFFNLDLYPIWIQHLSHILPMAHMVKVLQPLLHGTPLPPLQALWHIGFLTLITLLSLYLAAVKFEKKLVA